MGNDHDTLYLLVELAVVAGVTTLLGAILLGAVRLWDAGTRRRLAAHVDEHARQMEALGRPPAAVTMPADQIRVASRPPAGIPEAAVGRRHGPEILWEYAPPTGPARTRVERLDDWPRP